MLLQGRSATAPSLQYQWAGTAPSPQNPQHWPSAEVPGWHTTHWYHYTSPGYTSPWAVPMDAHTGPSASMEHNGTWTSYKSHLQNPLWDIRHTSPTCILQCRKRNPYIYVYLYYKLLLTARGVLWAAGEGHMSKQRFHCHGRGVPDAAAYTSKAKPGPEMPDTEEGSRVAACPIHLQIRPRIRWNCLAPLQPSSAQSPASAWSWKSAQTTSCVSLCVPKITCKQTKNRLKLFPSLTRSAS